VTTTDTIPRSSGRTKTRLPSDKTLIAAILAVALVVRVVLVLATAHRYVPNTDAADFSRIATDISKHFSFGGSVVPHIHGPGAFRTPLWPALLGATYAVLGVHWTAGRLVLAIVSTVLVALIGAFCWLILGRRVGLVSMAVAAVYPPLLLAGYGLNYEVLMGTMVFGALVCTLVWRRRPEQWWLLVVAGILSGLAVLCRENAGLVLVPICIMVWQRYHQQNARAAILRMGGLVLLAALVVIPWTVRNEMQFHSFVPVSDSPGMTIAGVYNPTSAKLDGEFVPPEVVPAYLHILRNLPAGDNEAQYASMMQAAAVHYAVHHPAYIVEIAYWNTLRFFDLRGPTDSNWLAPLIPWPTRLIELSVVSFYLLAAISIFGAVTRRIRGVPWALWTFPVLWVLSVIFSVSIMQYRFIIEPFFILMASMTVVDLYQKRHLGRTGTTAQTSEPTDSAVGTA
jgi:4-amino-4-deoxy-L-arabinose transferase-like glycosyltransferase